jgi:hypothetical protein
VASSIVEHLEGQGLKRWDRAAGRTRTVSDRTARVVAPSFAQLVLAT